MHKSPINTTRRQVLRNAAAFALGLLLCVALPVEAKKKLRPMDLECAAQTVAKRTGGKILAAKIVKRKKGEFFRIKVLTKRGRVRYVRISAEAKCVL